MNIPRATKFLESQAASCLERHRSTTDTDLMLKYSILADIYQTLAATLSILSYPDEA